jgi:putative SOS response-associated peptidase YedK
MLDSGGYLLRVEESGWRKDSICEWNEGRFSLRIRRSLGRLERPATNEWLRTCTIITGEPNDLVAQIHTRMPVILPEEDHAKWLGEVEDGDLKALLKPFPADQMRIWAISPRVNSPGE